MSKASKIREIKPVKALRGDPLLIDLGTTFIGEVTAWMKKNPNDNTYRSFTIIDGRYLTMTGEQTSDFYTGETLTEAVEGKWYYDVEWTPEGEGSVSKTIYTGSILFYNDITNSGGVQAAPIEDVNLTPFTIGINQPSHGFILGDAIRFNGTNYELALGDSEGNANVLGLVQQIIDVDNFIYQFSGIYTATSFADGKVYYLSNTTSGEIVPDNAYSTGDYKQYVGTAIENGFLLNIDAGEIVNEEEIISSQPIENEFDNIAKMLSDQANQTEGFLQFVADASADPKVTSSTDAYYEKLSGTTNSLNDYRLLSNSESDIIRNSDIWNVLTLENITPNTIPHTEVEKGGMILSYDIVDDFVTSILFNKTYSSAIQNLVSLFSADKVYFKGYNRTTRKYEVAKVISFTYIDSDYILATVEKTISSDNFRAGNEIVVEMDIDESGGGSQNFQTVTDGVGNNITTNPITTLGIQETGDFNAPDYKFVIGDRNYEGNGTKFEIDDATGEADLNAVLNVAILKIKNGAFKTEISSSVVSQDQNIRMADASGNFSIAPEDYNIVTNIPALADSDLNKKGVRYKNTVAGTRDFGSGNVAVGVGDILDNDGIIWYKSVDNNQSGGDFIPLIGTEVGEPVTGTVEFQDYTGKIINIKSLADTNFNTFIFADDGNLSITTEDDVTGYYKSLLFGGDSTNGLHIDGNNPKFYGFKGLAYYGDNYDDNTYIQRAFLNTPNYNATTNIPALSNTDADQINKTLRVSVAGTQDFGAGSIAFGVDDIIANDGLIWYKKVDNNQSGSQNFQQVTDNGAVTDNPILIGDEIELFDTPDGSRVWSIKSNDDLEIKNKNKTVGDVSLNISADGHLKTVNDNGFGITTNPIQATADRSILYPDKSGTFALLDDLSGFLPLLGGTMSGTINMNGSTIQLSDESGDIQSISTSNGNIIIGSDAYQLQVTADSGLLVTQGIVSESSISLTGNDSRIYMTDFNGSHNGFLTTVEALSVQRNWELPDASGTIALTSDLTSGNFQTVTDNGGFTDNDVEIDAELRVDDFLCSTFNIMGDNYAKTINLGTSTDSRSFDLPDKSGTFALTSDLGLSEWSTYTGTRAGGNLVLTLGDYDVSVNGTRIEINDNQSIITTTVGGSEIQHAGSQYFLSMGNQVGQSIILNSNYANIRIGEESGAIELDATTIRFKRNNTNYFNFNVSGNGIRNIDLPTTDGTIALTSDIDTKKWIDWTGRFSLNDTSLWYTFDDSDGYNDVSNARSRSDDGAGSPVPSWVDRGFFIPKGHKINKVVFIIQGSQALTDVDMAFYMRTNPNDNDDYTGFNGFTFTELYSDKYFNHSTLPTFTPSFMESKRTFIMPTAGGINEASIQDTRLVPYFKGVGGTVSLISNIFVEIEKI